MKADYAWLNNPLWMRNYRVKLYILKEKYIANEIRNLNGQDRDEELMN